MIWSDSFGPSGSMPLGRFFQKFFGFAFIPALSIVSPLLIMPVVARVGGAGDWAALGVGQAVGSFGSLVVAAGWTTAGPARVIESISTGGELDVYRVSFWQKLILFVGALFLLLPLTVVVVSESEVVAIAACVGALSLCFTLGWYAVGIGSPSISVRYYALPKTLITLFSVVPILLSSNVIWFGVFQFIGSVCGPLAFHHREFRSLLPPRVPLAEIRSSMLWSRDPGLIELSLAGAGMALLPVASALQPLTVVARLSSADKLYRYFYPVVDLIGDTLQKWVLSGSRDLLKVRLRLTVGLQGLTGAVLGIVAVVFGEPITAVLFGSSLSATEPVLVGYAVAILARSFSRPLLRNVIIPRGLVREVSRFAVVFALGFIALMVFLGRQGSGSVQGIVLAYAGYETAFLCLTILGRRGMLSRRTLRGNARTRREQM